MSRQAIQFSMSTSFNSIWPIDMILPGATTPGQSGPSFVYTQLNGQRVLFLTIQFRMSLVCTQFMGQIE